jgi:hypothetical protein
MCETSLVLIMLDINLEMRDNPNYYYYVLSIMFGNKDNNSLQFNKLYKIMKLYLGASFRFLA